MSGKAVRWILIAFFATVYSVGANFAFAGPLRAQNTNLIVNGNFTDGLTGWTARASTAEIQEDGSVKVTPNTSEDMPELYQLVEGLNLSAPQDVGRQFKITFDIRADEAVTPTNGNYGIVAIRYKGKQAKDFYFGISQAVGPEWLSYEYVFTYSYGSGAPEFYVRSEQGVTCYLRNISITELKEGATSIFPAGKRWEFEENEGGIAASDTELRRAMQTGIVMKAGSNWWIREGERESLQSMGAAAPYKSGDEWMIPLPAVADHLKIVQEYDETKGEYRLFNIHTAVACKDGQNQVFHAYLPSNYIQLQQPVQVTDGVLYVPCELLSKVFGVAAYSNAEILLLSEEIQEVSADQLKALAGLFETDSADE